MPPGRGPDLCQPIPNSKQYLGWSGCASGRGSNDWSTPVLESLRLPLPTKVDPAVDHPPLYRWQVQAIWSAMRWIFNVDVDIDTVLLSTRVGMSTGTLVYQSLPMVCERCVHVQVNTVVSPMCAGAGRSWPTRPTWYSCRRRPWDPCCSRSGSTSD